MHKRNALCGLEGGWLACIKCETPEGSCLRVNTIQLTYVGLWGQLPAPSLPPYTNNKDKWWRKEIRMPWDNIPQLSEEELRDKLIYLDKENLYRLHSEKRDANWKWGSECKVLDCPGWRSAITIELLGNKGAGVTEMRVARAWDLEDIVSNTEVQTLRVTEGSNIDHSGKAVESAP